MEKKAEDESKEIMKKNAGDWRGVPFDSSVEPENGNLDFNTHTQTLTH